MVRRLNRSSSLPSASVVDGVSGDTEIANLMASKLSTLLNSHSPVSCDSLLDSIQMSLFASEVQQMTVTEDDVLEAILTLKPIWHLPRHSHTLIVLSVAMIPYIRNIIFTRYTNFIQCCINSDIYIFHDSSYFVYTPTGYNFIDGCSHLKQFNDNDLNLAHIIKFYRQVLVFLLLMNLLYF